MLRQKPSNNGRPPCFTLLGTGPIDRPRHAHNAVDIVAIIAAEFPRNGLIYRFYLFEVSAFPIQPPESLIAST